MDCLVLPNEALLLATGIPAPIWVIPSVICAIILLIIMLILYYSTDIFDKGIFHLLEMYMYVTLIFVGIIIILTCGKTSSLVIATSTMLITFGAISLSNLFGYTTFSWTDKFIIVIISGIIGLIAGMFGRQIGKAIFCDKSNISKESAENLASKCASVVKELKNKNANLEKRVDTLISKS